MDSHAGILHHEEGVDLIPSNIELAGLEVMLVNAMSRELTLKNYLNEVKSGYDYVLIDCMPSLGMLTINALAASPPTWDKSGSVIWLMRLSWPGKYICLAEFS